MTTLSHTCSGKVSYHCCEYRTIISEEKKEFAQFSRNYCISRIVFFSGLQMWLTIIVFEKNGTLVQSSTSVQRDRMNFFELNL